MILEVNNTFDERRIYFLDRGQTATDKLLPDDGSTPPSTFSNTWTKDFHVSPFNSRKGSYSLNASDPFVSTPTAVPSINNIITLSSSKGHPKLVASIKSTASSIDPSSIGFVEFIQFIASWWWVGLVTFPRIVKEAAKLFFKRKLYVWYRPEVLQSSIGRTATSYERCDCMLI